MHRILLMNNKGYTLIESLFQLVIFVIFVQLFLLFFYWKTPIERQYSDKSSIAWEMFVVDLQDELANVQTLTIQDGTTGIQFKTSRGQIRIEQRNTVIRKSVDGQGHIPFLTNVSVVKFTLEGTTLFADATMLDGTRKERDFEIGFYTE